MRRSPDPPPAVVNIAAVVELERAALANRSRAERISDTIMRWPGSSVFLVAHVVWFGLWLSMGLGWLPGVPKFDPFPFSFLTMVVSLEAICLAIFVLISQNRMSRLADHRAHLDLQVNLLAEQEITTTLKLVQQIPARLGAGPVSDESVERLLRPTDVQELSTQLSEELPENK